MIQLMPLDPQKFVDTKNSNFFFPLVTEYLTSGKWSDEYWHDNYEWFYITDDSFESEEAKHTWIGIVCLTEARFENNLHLSVFEVAKPIRGLSIGTEIMDYLIDLGMKNHYRTMSLQVREPSLISFYKRFGFRQEGQYFMLKL